MPLTDGSVALWGLGTGYVLLFGYALVYTGRRWLRRRR